MSQFFNCLVANLGPEAFKIHVSNYMVRASNPNNRYNVKLVEKYQRTTRDTERERERERERQRQRQRETERVLTSCVINR